MQNLTGVFRGIKNIQSNDDNGERNNNGKRW